MADTRKEVLKKQFDSVTFQKAAEEHAQWVKEHPIASAALKVLSYPARVAILGGHGVGLAAEQFAKDKFDAKPPTVGKSAMEGRGYEDAKKLIRAGIGIDPID